MAHKLTVKRLCGILLIVFTLIMLLAMYVSQQIHLRSLPVVETIYESKEILRNTYTVQGTVAYETQIILRAPYPLTVVSVQKRVGETVKRGDALFTYFLEDIQLALLMAQKDAELCEQQVAQAQTGSAAGLLYQRQAENSRNTAAQLQKLIDNNGIVKSEVNGYIGMINVIPGDRVVQNGIIMTVYDKDGSIELQFQSPNMQYNFDNATFELPVTNGASVESQKKKLAITRKQYDAAARSLRYSVVVPATLSVEAYPGQIISGTVQTQSKQYGHTLPIACLYEDNSGRQYVYVIIERETVRGKVLYAQQRTVFVLDKDAANFSYTTEIKEPVIVSQSRYLTDLCEVRMMIGE
jgi:hypothetical protein